MTRTTAGILLWPLHREKKSFKDCKLDMIFAKKKTVLVFKWLLLVYMLLNFIQHFTFFKTSRKILFPISDEV